MSNVYIGSDFHLGHKNIHKFRHPSNGFDLTFENEQHHRDWLLTMVDMEISKRDTLLLLGDICFDEGSLEALHKITCRKVLVKGNHCVVKSPLYNKVFDQIHGLTRYKHVWLSHAPVHPMELRGNPNFHGHVHNETIDDRRYQNCCVEWVYKKYGSPIVRFDRLVEDRRIAHELS